MSELKEKIGKQEKEIRKLWEELRKERIRHKVLAILEAETKKDKLKQDELNRDYKTQIQQLEKKQEILEKKSETLQEDIEEERKRSVTHQKDKQEKVYKKEAKEKRKLAMKYDRLEGKHDILKKKIQKFLQKWDEERRDEYSVYILSKEKERRRQKRKEKRDSGKLRQN